MKELTILIEKQEYCWIDFKPINKSKAYALAELCFGANVANKLTYKDY